MLPRGNDPDRLEDPFALRRAAQGVVKILFEAKLPLEVFKLIGDLPELAVFFRERIQFYLRDVRGFAYDEVNAVMAVPMTTLGDLATRLEAIRAVRARLTLSRSRQASNGFRTFCPRRLRQGNAFPTLLMNRGSKAPRSNSFSPL